MVTCSQLLETNTLENFYLQFFCAKMWPSRPSQLWTESSNDAMFGSCYAWSLRRSSFSHCWCFWNCSWICKFYFFSEWKSLEIENSITSDILPNQANQFQWCGSFRIIEAVCKMIDINTVKTTQDWALISLWWNILRNLFKSDWR